MTRKKPANMAASVRQRLLNKARTDKRPFNELLQYFAMERFLYRLSRSPQVDKFVLKGALMLRVWQAPLSRPTMDIDMLARQINNETNQIIDQVRNICSVPVESDGLQFDLESIQGERIVEDADYEGVRVSFFGKLDTAKIKMQIDIGFGDTVVPDPQEMALPTILDFPPPLLICYSRESAIAEKFETMIKLGELNSRMKDFYDIWLLARQFNFDGQQLQEAISETLNNRGTNITDEISAFSDDFVQNKSSQWKAFSNKLKIDTVPTEFVDVIALLRKFIVPITEKIRSDAPATDTWIAPGPWQ